jgi:hypothetical protein
VLCPCQSSIKMRAQISSNDAFIAFRELPVPVTCPGFRFPCFVPCRPAISDSNYVPVANVKVT